MGQIVADVQSGLSLTPPQEKRRRKNYFMEPFACWAILHAYDLKHKKRREHIHCHGQKNYQSFCGSGRPLNSLWMTMLNEAFYVTVDGILAKESRYTSRKTTVSSLYMKE
jgi:hypothetical protein